jgi:hypothetical protein
LGGCGCDQLEAKAIPNITFIEILLVSKSALSIAFRPIASFTLAARRLRRTDIFWPIPHCTPISSSQIFTGENFIAIGKAQEYN